MCVVVIPQFSAFLFDPESTLAEIEPEVVAKWNLQSIETEFATVLNATEITRWRGGQTRLHEICFDEEDLIIHQGGTIDDDPGEGAVELPAVATSALTSTAPRRVMFGGTRKEGALLPPPYLT
jgi:hypothetical protein